jgi:hypothetical protein
MAFTKVTDNLLSSGVGTGAGNILELDSSGKLPAVDGSLLTGVGVDGIVSTANATAITIDSNENVGIGTTSIDSKLRVHDGTAAGLRIGYNNTGVNYYDADTHNFRDSATNLRVVINPSGRILASTGITLGNGTTYAAANTLNDYEEGTWTPTLGGNATYSIQSGKYTKIGRQVYISCVLSVTTLGTGSTTTVSGFPFTSSNVGGGNMGGSVFYFASLAANVIAPTLYKANGTTSTAFKSNTAASTGISGNLAIFGNSSRVDFSMTYEVS